MFSFIFHPIFVSVYGALFYFYISRAFFNKPEVYLSLLQIFIITVLLPLAFYALLRTLKKVNSFTEASLQERKMPVFLQLVLLFLLMKFSILKLEYPYLYTYTQAGFYSAFIAFGLLFFKQKASLHMIGTVAFCSFSVLFCYSENYEASVYLILALLLMGSVATSRLVMKSHTVYELILGSLVGIIPQIILFLL
jgi:hypothetical protein